MDVSPTSLRKAARIVEGAAEMAIDVHPARQLDELAALPGSEATRRAATALADEWHRFHRDLVTALDVYADNLEIMAEDVTTVDEQAARRINRILDDNSGAM